MLRPLIAGNWKMHKTATEAVDFVSHLLRIVVPNDEIEIRLYPAATAIRAVYDAVGSCDIGVGAQNLHQEDNGAYTGEISGPMLKGAGASSVLVGHSERRQLFGESDEIIARKVATAQRHALNVILCVGETLSERESGQAEAVVERQVRSGLQYLVEAPLQIDIAYEPVWAIGTGKTATSEQAQHMHQFIRGLLREPMQNSRILYGGSVKPENATDLLSQPDIQGVLVGGASLEPAAFAGIIAASGLI